MKSVGSFLTCFQEKEGWSWFSNGDDENSYFSNYMFQRKNTTVGAYDVSEVSISKN